MTAILATVGGCVATTVRSVDAELARLGTGLREDTGQRIDGYRLQDAGEYAFKGQVRLAGADSLVFWTEQSTHAADDFGSGAKMRVPGPVLPAKTVAALKVVEPDHASAAAGIAAGVVFVALIAKSWSGLWEDWWGDWDTSD